MHPDNAGGAGCQVRAGDTHCGHQGGPGVFVSGVGAIPESGTRHALNHEDRTLVAYSSGDYANPLDPMARGRGMGRGGGLGRRSLAFAEGRQATDADAERAAARARSGMNGWRRKCWRTCARKNISRRSTPIRPRPASMFLAAMRWPAVSFAPPSRVHADYVIGGVGESRAWRTRVPTVSRRTSRSRTTGLRRGRGRNRPCEWCAGL